MPSATRERDGEAMLCKKRRIGKADFIGQVRNQAARRWRRNVSSLK